MEKRKWISDCWEQQKGNRHTYLSPTEPTKRYKHILYFLSTTNKIMRGNQSSSHSLHLPPYILQAETPTSNEREKLSLTNLIALNDSRNNPNVFALGI